ncbi:o-succinylbenzoate synthase [Dehalobacter sp. DCM]|uniref:o-succinylbenzoate synthase n=1 Tax=Dehalobacter sp. DCM TaxID=2907827 RepID=UPI003081816F|nr:o-succinylbenzoate synthase [Dehalobacter sp. DCM]
MKIKKIELFHIRMPLNFIFKTSQTNLNYRETLIIKIADETGITGFGEVVAFNEPFYTKETLADAKRVLIEVYIPWLTKTGQSGHSPIRHPFEVHKEIGLRYPMALAGLENALLDLFARQQEKPLMAVVFGETTTTKIEAGMVLGDLEINELLSQIGRYYDEGYRRFKIKIKPADGYRKLQKIREKYPHLMLLADANRSFGTEDISELLKIDALGLMCLEEPLIDTLPGKRMAVYQDLQSQLRTPLCLDESILTMDDLEEAVRYKACRTVNIKTGRVGGLYHVKKMIECCRRNGIGYWIGSMVESGISKILHVHLASLMDTYIPGDLSPSRRYFTSDLIEPEIVVKDGKIDVPQGPGLGIAVDEAMLAHYTIDQHAMEK